MPNDPLARELLKEAEEFCRETGWSHSRLGREVMNDGSFFTRLREGRGFTTKTYSRFTEFFARARERRRGREDVGAVDV